MALNYGTALINGQLIPTPMDQSFDPLTYGAVLSGPGYWPPGTQYNVPPLLPASAVTSAAAEYSPGLSGGSGAMIPTAGKVKSNGQVNWLHPAKSPVLWVIGLLGLSLFMLHKVHYGK